MCILGTRHFNIILIVPPGPPLAVRSDDISDTSVTVSWSPPDNLGVPQLNYYQLIIAPSPPINDIFTTNLTSLLVNGLLPNTVYNITVLGVSTGDNFDMLLGDESTTITIITLTGGESKHELYGLL